MHTFNDWDLFVFFGPDLSTLAQPDLCKSYSTDKRQKIQLSLGKQYNYDEKNYGTGAFLEDMSDIFPQNKQILGSVLINYIYILKKLWFKFIMCFCLNSKII